MTILIENIVHKTFTQPAVASVLADYLIKNFPDCEYHSAYEAGFSGFRSHYELLDLGINNIVINASDIPTTQKEMF